jgi:tetratricopeptide (TPR) repeat protein
MFQGRAREAIPVAQAAVEEAERVDEFDALAHAYTALDGSYQLLGQPEKAVHERKAVEVYRRMGDARSAGIYAYNVGGQAYADGKWDEAVELYVRSKEDCLRAGDRNNAAYADASLAELLIGREQLDDAERLLTDARRVLRSSSFAVFALFAEIQLARCALARGDAVAARDSLEQLALEAETVGYAAIMLEAGIYLAHASAQTGSPARGLDALDAAVSAAGQDATLYEAGVERARAACCAALGDREGALACLERALDAATRQGLLYDQLLTRRARLTLTEGREDGEELREVERLAQLLGTPI